MDLRCKPTHLNQVSAFCPTLYMLPISCFSVSVEEQALFWVPQCLEELMAEKNGLPEALRIVLWVSSTPSPFSSLLQSLKYKAWKSLAEIYKMCGPNHTEKLLFLPLRPMVHNSKWEQTLLALSQFKGTISPFLSNGGEWKLTSILRVCLFVVERRERNIRLIHLISSVFCNYYYHQTCVYIFY